MKLVGALIGLDGRHRLPQRGGTGQLLEGCREAPVDPDDGAAIGHILSMRVRIARPIGQRSERVRAADEQLRHRELRSQFMRLRQIVPQRDLALLPECLLQRPGIDVGIAVAIAADPGAHTKERRDGLALAEFLEFGVEAGYLAKKGCVVVAQRVLDLVADRQAGKSQQPGLPHLHHARLQQRLIVVPLAIAPQMLPFAQEPRNRVLSIKQGLSPCFGRMGREHRRDDALRERARDRGRR